MQIVIVNGSPRVNGAAGKILREFERCLLAHNDVCVEFIEKNADAYRVTAERRRGRNII